MLSWPAGDTVTLWGAQRPGENEFRVYMPFRDEIKQYTSQRSVSTCSENVNIALLSHASLRVRHNSDAVAFTAVDVGYLTSARIGLTAMQMSILAHKCHIVP